MIESARQCLTGIDNQTIDPGRVGGAAATAVFLALSIADMAINHHFDPLAFGGGFGALASGVGVLLALKAPTEPKP